MLSKVKSISENFSRRLLEQQVFPAISLRTRSFFFGDQPNSGTKTLFYFIFFLLKIKIHVGYDDPPPRKHLLKNTLR